MGRSRSPGRRSGRRTRGRLATGGRVFAAARASSAERAVSAAASRSASSRGRSSGDRPIRCGAAGRRGVPRAGPRRAVRRADWRRPRAADERIGCLHVFVPPPATSTAATRSATTPSGASAGARRVPTTLRPRSSRSVPCVRTAPRSRDLSRRFVGWRRRPCRRFRRRSWFRRRLWGCRSSRRASCACRVRGPGPSGGRRVGASSA